MCVYSVVCGHAIACHAFPTEESSGMEMDSMGTVAMVPYPLAIEQATGLGLPCFNVYLSVHLFVYFLL